MGLTATDNVVWWVFFSFVCFHVCKGRKYKDTFNLQFYFKKYLLISFTL